MSETEQTAASDTYTSPEIEEVFDRVAIPKDDSVMLYHYCSAETLLAVLKTKTIRFSEATCLNDGEEVIWASKQIAIALQRLVDRDDLDDAVPAISRKFREKFESEWKDCNSITRQFIASFSHVGDSLSQWRAYADNGRGFAVGFDISCLDVPARVFRIEYEIFKQQEIIIDAITKMYLLGKHSEKYFDSQFANDVLALYQASSSFKNPAFTDEREIRAVHLALQWVKENGFPQLYFTGGSVEDKDIDEAEIHYRVTNGRLIPFFDFPFQLVSECPIKEIWLGPRCATSVSDLSVFLGTFGYSDIQIKAAGSLYR